MHLISSILRLRWQALSRKEQLPESILLLLLAGLYFYVGMQVAEWLSRFNGRVPASLLHYLYLALLAGPLVMTFVPAFSVKTAFLPGYLPLKPGVIFGTDLLLALGRRPFVAGLFTLAGLAVFYRYGTTAFWLDMACCVLAAGLLSECLTNIISWKRFLLLPLLLVPAAIAYINFTGATFGAWRPVVHVLVLLLLLVVCRLSFSLNPPAGLQPVATGKRPGSRSAILYKEVLQHHTAVTVLAVAFAAKLIILFIVPLKTGLQTGHFQQNPLQFIFFTPVFLFGYLFSNTFGYFRNLFLSTWLYNNKAVEYARLYARLLLPFLAADLLVSMVFLYVQQAFEHRFLVFYLLLAAYGIAVSVISSVADARPVDGFSASFLKKNTSPVASLLLVGPLLLMLYYQQLPLLLLPLAGTVLAWAGLLLLYARQRLRWTTRLLQQLKS